MTAEKALRSASYRSFAVMLLQGLVRVAQVHVTDKKVWTRVEIRLSKPEAITGQHTSRNSCICSRGRTWSCRFARSDLRWYRRRLKFSPGQCDNLSLSRRLH